MNTVPDLSWQMIYSTPITVQRILTDEPCIEQERLIEICERVDADPDNIGITDIVLAYLADEISYRDLIWALTIKGLLHEEVLFELSKKAIQAALEHRILINKPLPIAYYTIMEYATLKNRGCVPTKHLRSFSMNILELQCVLEELFHNTPIEIVCYRALDNQLEHLIPSAKIELIFGVLHKFELLKDLNSRT